VTKVSKAKAHYRPGSTEKHCGICTMFVKPHNCTKVMGEIDASRLCDYFERRKGGGKMYNHPSSGKM